MSVSKKRHGTYSESSSDNSTASDAPVCQVARLHSMWGRKITTRIHTVSSSMSIVKLFIYSWYNQTAPTTLTRWSGQPSFKTNLLHVLTADLSILVVTGMSVSLFVGFSPIGTDMLDGFLSSVKGSSFFCWKYYAWWFPSTEERFVVNEFLFATKIFCWRWCNRKDIWVGLLLSNKQWWCIGCCFQFSWTHGQKNWTTSLMLSLFLWEHGVMSTICT